MSYPLVNVYKELWNILIVNGKTHYFNGPFSIAIAYDYQRVLFHSVGNFRIPTDEFICFRGVGTTGLPIFNGHATGTD